MGGSRRRKKGSSGEFSCQEFTRWRFLLRDSLLVRSSLPSLSRTPPCSMSHYTRTRHEETETQIMNRQPALESSPSTLCPASRRASLASSQNCPSSAEL